mgnify:CR=1 FL=1
MSTKKVIFSNPGDVIDFVKIVEKYPFDMDMKRGRYIVDAKSLLGLMNLGFDQKIELKVYDEETVKMIGKAFLEEKPLTVRFDEHKIKKAELIAYEDLGAEALRRLEVEDMPLFVIIDCDGNNLYEMGRKEYLEAHKED